MRISIITLALDLPPYLQEAIDSVEREPALDLEHIIVHDGDDADTDALRQKYPAIKVLKGRQAGATTAATLGVEVATGDFILFLHSDDRLCAGALARLAGQAAARPDVKIWTGGTRIFYTAPDGADVTARWITERDLTRLSLENVCDATPLLSARFCSRSVFSQIGNFDPDFSESSDREFLLRAIVAGIPEAPLDVMVSEMRMHKGSRTLHGRRGVLPPYLVEHVEIADMWLARPGVNARTRQYLRNWRARELLRLLVHQCRLRQWKQAAAGVLAAVRTEPSWIFRMLSILAVQPRRRHHGVPRHLRGAALP